MIQSGVDLARKTGKTMTPFNYVITSPKERAYETAIAMGYAVDEFNEGLESYGEDLENEFNYVTLTFSKIKSLLNKDTLTLKFAQDQVILISNFLKKIKEGEKLLLISHGGIIEIPLVYLLPNEDHTNWGLLFGCCEGYRITIDGETIVSYELLRTT